MKESNEVLIRSALARYPRPSPSSVSVAEIVAASIRYEAARSTRPAWAKQAVLACYWFAAFTGTLAILLSVPLPEWRPSALTTFNAWAIPVVGVLVLCCETMMKVLQDWSARLFSDRF